MSNTGFYLNEAQGEKLVSRRAWNFANRFLATNASLSSMIQIIHKDWSTRLFSPAGRGGLFHHC